MAIQRDTYGNSASTGFTIDFFAKNAVGASDAFLASPFFTTYAPISLLSERGCNVRLLVRLCSITYPALLRRALEDPCVSVRYYTSRSFHAKLYIIDDVALVGSANLTDAGLHTNREVSVVLAKGLNPGFDALPTMFSMFWEFADVLTSDICDKFEEAFRVIGKPNEERQFQDHLEKLIPPAKPPSAKVGSDKVSSQRSFLQALRRKYDEKLIPAFREIEARFQELGQRRAEFVGADIEIELGRFLGWVRVAMAPGDNWNLAELVEGDTRKKRIDSYLRQWLSTDDIRQGDIFEAQNEAENIAALRKAFSSPSSIEALGYDEIFDALSACHAFNDRQRFVKGGRVGHKLKFGRENSLPAIKSSLTYLLHGKTATPLERAYDCLHDENKKLNGFAEACVMELIGWVDVTRPPINGRTIKAIRFLGFDVRD